MAKEREACSRGLLEHAIRLAQECRAKALLVHAESLDEGALKMLEPLGRKVLLVARGVDSTEAAPHSRHEMIAIPPGTGSRQGQLNGAILLALTRGMFRRSDRLVGLTRDDRDGIEVLLLIDVGVAFGAFFRGRQSRAALEKIRPDVFERAMSVATQLGSEGREGLPVGALFVVGDTRRVSGLTRPMVLNPFQGYPESERNILDPRLTETVKEYSTLDGAFIIREDGVIVTAGAFLVPGAASDSVPLGLGARHQAAAAITLVSDSIAVVLSRSTGAVTVFRQGKIVTEIETRTREARVQPATMPKQSA